MLNRGGMVSDNQTTEEEVASLPTEDDSRAVIGRWVPMDDAAAEMAVSRSTLERRIRKGEVEAVKQGRNVFVLVHGQEPVSDAELLEGARSELAESEQTVAKLRETESSLRRNLERLNESLEKSERRESTLMTERDEASDMYHEERKAHRFTWWAFWFVFAGTLLLAIMLFTQVFG